ncbi:RNA polymerase sigma factor [Paludisphaera sp.]|uniref:RNA polymerase sigma factor n=1 Tax=Paludisphaera sp. TaxID=2017432 RepID=UPI00301C8768
MRAFRQSPDGLRALFAGGSTTGMTDGELLERFRARTGPADAAAESAFEALVDRHAAMVWGVCRRSLGRADAEDAFQATFVVLVRRAGSIRVDGRGSAGRWVYGVARKVSARLRSEARRRPSAIVDPARHDDPATLAERRDVRDAVADELDRLPPKYRRPIELCDFEGLTYEQAGLSLGWPTATIKSRLARGRSRLRSRLERRGLAPSAAFVLASFALEARAGVPKSLIPPTLRAAALASGLIPGAVARLADGVIRAMLMEKLKPLALLLIAGAATAAVARSAQDPATPQRPPIATTAEAPPEPEPDRRFIRHLDDGTVLEVVAVGDNRTGATSWWRPDGTPLREAPYDPGQAVSNPNPIPVDALSRKLLVRIVGAPETTDISVGLPSRSYNARRMVDDARPVLTELSALYPETQASAVVEFRSAAGPWNTVSEWIEGMGAIGGGEHRNFVFGDVMRAGAPRTDISLAHDVGDDETVRIVAVDEEGREHDGTRLGASARHVRLLTATFDLPRERIKRFRVQVRPWTTITIPDIALQPRAADNPR